MKLRRTGTWLLLIALGLFMLTALFSIIHQRLASGDLYPHYASYRNDPLGTSAIYETFAGMEGVETTRNTTHLNTIKGLDEDSALLLIGYPANLLHRLRVPADSAVSQAVENGARLVVTLNPGLVPRFFEPKSSEREKDWFERRRELQDKKLGNNPAPSDDSDDENTDDASTDDPTSPLEETAEEESEEMIANIGPSFSKFYDFSIASNHGFRRPDDGWPTTLGQSPDLEGLTNYLPHWHSHTRFDPPPAPWRVVLQVDGQPVLIERPVGKGSVVLASDSYFTSNEALHNGEQPEFLLWLIGDKSRLVFDETIHGSVQTGGAGVVLRRYRLQGILLGILVLVILWAWRSAAPLAPQAESDDELKTPPVSGQNSNEGLVRLLKRSIPLNQLLRQCYDTWKESTFNPLPPDSAHQLHQALQAHQAEPKRHDIFQTYRAIVSILRKR